MEIEYLIKSNNYLNLIFLLLCILGCVLAKCLIDTEIKLYIMSSNPLLTKVMKFNSFPPKKNEEIIF